MTKTEKTSAAIRRLRSAAMDLQTFAAGVSAANGCDARAAAVWNLAYLAGYLCRPAHPEVTHFEAVEDTFHNVARLLERIERAHTASE